MIQEEKLNKLRFAYDILIFANDESELKEMLS